MPARVEILMQVCINGRPIWRKARLVKPELSQLMTDKEYDKAIEAAARELAGQVREWQAKEKAAAAK